MRCKQLTNFVNQVVNYGVDGVCVCVCVCGCVFFFNLLFFFYSTPSFVEPVFKRLTSIPRGLLLDTGLTVVPV